MKTIRVAYSSLENAGDVFNKECIEKLSGRKVIRSKTYNADMLAIGGALVGAQYFPKIKYRLMQRCLAPIYENRPLYVWGSGFIRNDNDRPLFRKNLIICALRGKETQKKLSKIMNQNLDVPLADGGLIIDSFLGDTFRKSYDVGIIPHFSQQNEEVFQILARQFNHSLMIDIRKSPLEVARDISKCEVIISSSLHGLVFADSLHIPSLHVVGTAQLLGGMFKFDDYYSSFGVSDYAWKLVENLPSINDVIDNYKISSWEVDKKKQQLIDAFPDL